MALLSNYTPVLEQNSIDEAWLDMTGTEGLFGNPLKAAKRIMDEIKDRLGLPCSIGIARNKFLSKMAAEIRKSLSASRACGRKIFRLTSGHAVKEMYGVGAKTAEKLNRMGIKTVGDLARSDVNLIVRTFGKGRE